MMKYFAIAVLCLVTYSLEQISKMQLQDVEHEETLECSVGDDSKSK